jgi:hypothetical protein
MNRVQLIRTFNPQVEVFGFFGGRLSETRPAQDYFRGVLKDVFSMQDKPALWKWGNQDLAIRAWHAEVGKNAEFDMLHFLEWDLVLFASLDELFGHVGPDTLGLTALTPIANIERDWLWTGIEPFRTDYVDLIHSVETEFKYNGQPQACFGVGGCYPRTFLDKYVAAPLPEITHNEIRLPLFAQILGYQLVDNGLSKGVFCEESEYAIFNVQRQEISVETMCSQLADPKGRRGFHPYYSILDIDRTTKCLRG